MAKETTVLSFGDNVFFFYPKKVKEGYVNVFNSRNHCIGRAKVLGVSDIADQVENWLVEQNLVGS